MNPEFHPKLILWMARCGLTELEMGVELGLPSSELAAWKKEYPEIAEAIKHGDEYWSQTATQALRKMAKGYEAQETKATLVACAKCGSREAQNIERTTKVIPPNVAAATFILRNSAVFKIAEAIKKDSPEVDSEI